MRFRFMMLGLLVGVAGCGGVKVAPVSGRITLDEKPLANATVIFQRLTDEKNPGPGSQGKTDRNGQYTLHLMTGTDKGAVVGIHKVSITAYEGDDKVPSSGSDMVFRKALLPLEYNAKSILTFDVPPEGTASADFKLKSTGPDPE